MVSLEEMRKAEAEVQVAAEMKHEAIEKREIETKAEAPIPLRNASLLAFSTKPNGLRAMRMAAGEPEPGNNATPCERQERE
jgi:hypothetical protein